MQVAPAIVTLALQARHLVRWERVKGVCMLTWRGRSNAGTSTTVPAYHQLKSCICNHCPLLTCRARRLLPLLTQRRCNRAQRHLQD